MYHWNIPVMMYCDIANLKVLWTLTLGGNIYVRVRLHCYVCLCFRTYTSFVLQSTFKWLNFRDIIDKLLNKPFILYRLSYRNASSLHIFQWIFYEFLIIDWMVAFIFHWIFVLVLLPLSTTDYLSHWIFAISYWFLFSTLNSFLRNEIHWCYHLCSR